MNRTARNLQRWRSLVPERTYYLGMGQHPISDRVTQAHKYLDPDANELGYRCKATLSLKDMYSYLDQCFIVEKMEDGSYFCRLFSAGSVDLFRADWTNKTISPDGIYRDWIPRYDSVIGNGSAEYHLNRMEMNTGEQVRAESGLFPLTAKDGSVKFVMTVYDFMPENGPTLA